MTDDDVRDEPVQIGADEYPSRKEREQLRDLDHVIGHQIGHPEDNHKEVCVCVYVDEKVPEEDLDDDQIVPREFCGCKTDVIEREFTFDTMYDSRKAVHRPAAGGTMFQPGGSNSVGTINGSYWDTGANQPVVGVSGHVLNSLGASESESIGTDVYQPLNSEDRWHLGEVTKATAGTNETGRTDLAFVDPTTSNTLNDFQLSTHVFGHGRLVNIQEPELDRRYMSGSQRSGVIGGRCTGIDMSVEIAGTVMHGLFEIDSWGQGGDSGSPIGYVTDEGDFTLVGNHVGGPQNSAGRLCMPMSELADDPGLDTVEPLIEHEDHDLVSTDPPTIPDDVDPFIEAHPRHLNWTGSEFEVSVYFVNTGGSRKQSTFTIEGPAGSTVVSDSIALNSGDSEIREYTVSGYDDEEKLFAYTDEQLAAFETYDREMDIDYHYPRLEFTQTQDLRPTGHTESGPSEASNLTVASTTTDSIELSWDASSDSNTAGYYVHVDGDYSIRTETTSATVTGLASGSTYDFAVEPHDAGHVTGSPISATGTTDEESGGGTTDPPAGDVAYIHATAEVSGIDDDDPNTPTRAAARFDGEIAAIRVNAPDDANGVGQIELDGEIIDPDDYPDEPSGDPSPPQTALDPPSEDREYGSAWARPDLLGEIE